MAQESPEQVREKHIRDMGPELGPVYHELYREVAWLHAKWNQYRKLYGHSRKRFAILQKVASHFFEVVEDALYHDVLLHLMRLTDPATAGGYKNLSLQALSERVRDPKLACELRKLVKAAREACETARASRDKRIAHTDLERALAGTFDPYPSRLDVEIALGAVRAVLHCLEKHYWQAETPYRDVIPAGGDADSLMRYLRMALREEQRWVDRLVQGKALPEDLEPEDEVLTKMR